MQGGLWNWGATWSERGCRPQQTAASGAESTGVSRMACFSPGRVTLADCVPWAAAQAAFCSEHLSTVGFRKIDADYWFSFSLLHKQ